MTGRVLLGVVTFGISEQHIQLTALDRRFERQLEALDAQIADAARAAVAAEGAQERRRARARYEFYSSARRATQARWEAERAELEKKLEPQGPVFPSMGWSNSPWETWPPTRRGC